MDDQANQGQSTYIPAKPKARSLHWIGYVLTVVWLALIAWYWRADTDSLLALEPNEFGDFLAGTFAPLAFLWLVLGFLQQGEELRHSADALWLQGQELQNSVEQQRELVNVTREQLQFEAKMLEQQREEIALGARPILRLEQGGSVGAGNGERLYDFRLLNVGRPCTAVVIYINDSLSPFVRAPVLDKGGQVEFRRTLPIGEIEPFKLTVTFLDERMTAGTKSYMVSGGNSRFEITDID